MSEAQPGLHQEKQPPRKLIHFPEPRLKISELEVAQYWPSFAAGSFPAMREDQWKQLFGSKNFFRQDELYKLIVRFLVPEFTQAKFVFKCFIFAEVMLPCVSMH